MYGAGVSGVCNVLGLGGWAARSRCAGMRGRTSVAGCHAIQAQHSNMPATTSLLCTCLCYAHAHAAPAGRCHCPTQRQPPARRSSTTSTMCGRRRRCCLHACKVRQASARQWQQTSAIAAAAGASVARPSVDRACSAAILQLMVHCLVCCGRHNRAVVVENAPHALNVHPLSF